MIEHDFDEKENKENINEPSIMDRISGWFTEENLN